MPVKTRLVEEEQNARQVSSTCMVFEIETCAALTKRVSYECSRFRIFMHSILSNQPLQVLLNSVQCNKTHILRMYSFTITCAVWCQSSRQFSKY